MKILFPIGTLYPSQEGGPSNTVYWMAKALVTNGVSVTIVTTDAGTRQKVRSDTWLETAYGRVRYCSFRAHQLPLTMMVVSIAQIRRHDCIHLNSLFHPPAFVAATIAILLKKPVIWSCRGNLNDNALIYSAWKKKPVLWLIKHFLSGKHVLFHATSREEHAHISHIIGAHARVLVIPNFLELPMAEKPALVDRPYLLYVGRIHPVKALDRLLEALFISTSFRNSDFILKIAGDQATPYGEQLKKQVRESGLDQKVEFTGHIEGREKQQFFAGAYFTILPSHTENFGNVVIESLAQGTPVIASKGTPWQMLEQEKAGFYTENTPEQLADAIDGALALSPNEYAACRKNALHLAETRFDIHKNIQVWIDAYRAVLPK